MEMKKYSQEWKIKTGKWIQRDGDVWNIHYIRYGSEYSFGDFFTASSAREYMKDFKA
jgi:hypothetical protein